MLKNILYLTNSNHSSLTAHIYDNFDTIKWDWNSPGKERDSNTPIIENGLTYKEYYDKVEQLLNWAVYYTAAALKWTMKEVNKYNKDQLDPNQWAKENYEDFSGEQVPNPNPPDKQQEKEVADSYYNAKSIITITAALAPILALVFAIEIIKTVKSKGIPVSS